MWVGLLSVKTCVASFLIFNFPPYIVKICSYAKLTYPMSDWLALWLADWPGL